MKLAIHINPHTQKWIADEYNEGVEPQLEDETTIFIPGDDETHSEIVSVDDFDAMSENGGWCLRTRRPRN